MIELFRLLLSRVMDIFGDGVMLSGNVIDFGLAWYNGEDKLFKSSWCHPNKSKVAVIIPRGSLSCIGIINSKYPPAPISEEIIISPSREVE